MTTMTSPNAFWILFILGIMILLFLAWLIVMIASEVKHGKIIVRVVNEIKCDEHEDLVVFDSDDNPVKICLRCGRREGV